QICREDKMISSIAPWKSAFLMSETDCRYLAPAGESRQGPLPLPRRAFPGCGAARSGAPLIRDRRRLRVCYDPGSAAHHFATLRAALRPGNASRQSGYVQHAVEDQTGEQDQTRVAVGLEHVEAVVRIADIQSRDLPGKMGGEGGEAEREHQARAGE